ncbi:MAG: DNA-3-methyladenine glycosylase 2 family protein [Dokdonella sp.]|uniref:DNA-3-methyladenine glycosylase 2 n=1 Tax=Dokdonella sp. TaxID=2291710 RepID=UPI0025B99F08|nr:DNA-3-methyladenine glycosylase 2 [Dokdonella sp.]MBK8124242.1 DNA-3-methyladenine glycosylase 2 family protein [Dokdonella sp.]
MSAPSATIQLDPAICEQARLTRDARFDGLFFTAVKTTGIYCRPVCPAPTPKPGNIHYYPSAAAAAAAGYRPCLRCRPEAAPGSPVHRANSELISAALQMIEHGALDGGSVGELAARIGVGERHLRRLFEQEIGASPNDVAATRRLLFAKQLLLETGLSITSVAAAAGYASLRRFNAAFLEAFAKPPRDFRRGVGEARTSDALTLRIPYRQPYDFAGLLEFLSRRAIPGVECVEADEYRRSFRIGADAGWFSVAARSDDAALQLCVHGARPHQLGQLAARVRRMFDVDADPAAISRVLGADRLLRPLTRRWPGQRLPCAWDAFELGVRAVLGQQISVAAARTFASRIVERFGTAHDASLAHGLGRLFPEPEQLADAPLESIGLPRARAETLRSLARAFRDEREAFSSFTTREDIIARLQALPGIGAWTANYMAMRAFSHPDAFPAGDLVLRKIIGKGTPVTERKMLERAEAWRPWRAYAVMLLWRSTN